MASFNAGPHEWKVRFTVGLLTAIKREIGIDLAGMLVDAERFANVMFAEPEKIAECLWMLCEVQAAAAGITPEQFAGLLGPDELDAAADALTGAAVDFFPKARGREAIRKAMPRAMKNITEKVNKAVEEKLSTFFDTAGNSPDSPP